MNSDISEGKKLGFICQEIGREVNTIGPNPTIRDATTSGANERRIRKNKRTNTQCTLKK